MCNPQLRSASKYFCVVAAFLLSVTASAQQTEKDKFDKKAKVGKQADDSYVVPTTQIIDPAGTNITFPGRPVDLALNPSETILAVKNINELVFFKTSNNTITQHLKLPEGGNTFTGIAWSDGGQKVWTTDTKGYLRSAKLKSNGQFAWVDAIPLPYASLTKGELAWENEVLDKSSKASGNRQYPGGIAVDESHSLIYVTLNKSNSLGIVNIKTGKFEGYIPVGVAPYAVKLVGSKAYVTNWGGRLSQKKDKTALSAETPVVIDKKTGVASSGTVSVIDLASRKVTKEIRVQLHPSGMALSPDGALLYVANANSDAISVISTASDKVVKNINPKPLPDLPFGSAPNALTVSGDGNTLYVANGGNNVVAVIDLKKNQVKGLIPTGWYPGAVALNKAGDRLFVANIKGVGTRQLSSPSAKGFKSNDHLGSVSFIPVPSADVLESYTVKAATNMRLPEITQAMNLEHVAKKLVPVPMKPGEKSVFKHVIYIIKENKTYDQVFGDLKQGNGDPNLVQFGREVTPNIHKLAESFVLLDNTYCNGVTSADGHQWTDEGYVTDYLEKSFGGFIRSYPYRGDDPLAFSSAGFIWDKVLKKGLTFRNYGEFVKADVITPKNATWSQIYADYKNNTNLVKIKAETEVHTLMPYTCPTYPGFTGKVPDVYRAKEFLKEFRAYEEKGELPNFITMLLPDDHTMGVNENYPFPSAAVADNDLALGQIVEAVSKSKFWKETAIFVIQDDSQTGLDHVDGKRTVALCISPYTKRGEVISVNYNQNSILRTIELIFGLSPMTQMDLTATPMNDCFIEKPDFTPYTALPNQIPLDKLNPKISSLKGKQLFWAKKSMKMDLEEVDEIEDDTFNKIIWYAVKGYDTPYPKLMSKD
ncbi:MAG: Phosphoesterase family protein [Sphingobacteriaceae bacterium]|nr:Phosphoesterase family protein [Sphingobacteriaceae bacterium]